MKERLWDTAAACRHNRQARRHSLERRQRERVVPCRRQAEDVRLAQQFGELVAGAVGMKAQVWRRAAKKLSDLLRRLGRPELRSAYDHALDRHTALQQTAKSLGQHIRTLLWN